MGRLVRPSCGRGVFTREGWGLQQGAEGLEVAGLDGFEGGLEGWVVHGGGGIKLGQRLRRRLLGGGAMDGRAGPGRTDSCRLSACHVSTS